MYAKRNDGLYYKCYSTEGENRTIIGYVGISKGSETAPLNAGEVANVIKNPTNSSMDGTYNAFVNQFCNIFNGMHSDGGGLSGNYENYDGSWIGSVSKISGGFWGFIEDSTTSFELYMPIYGEKLSGASEFVSLSGESIS